MSAFLLSTLSQTVSASTGQRHTCHAHSPGAARLCGPRSCQLSLVTALLASLLQASFCNGPLSSEAATAKERAGSIPTRNLLRRLLFSFTLFQHAESAVASD